ncbi:MAG: RNA polymerase subunit sigma-70, partial [Clostridia bacterium]|nr:RNA polymerase subunit sigma-70 [Clostridia bacterium]
MLELLRRVSPFILSKSKQFGSTEQDVQDYYQEGVVGFLSAVFAYRPDCGATFTTFACTCSLNRMKNLLRRRHKEIALQLSDS